MNNDAVLAAAAVNEVGSNSSSAAASSASEVVVSKGIDPSAGDDLSPLPLLSPNLLLELSPSPAPVFGAASDVANGIGAEASWDRPSEIILSNIAPSDADPIEAAAPAASEASLAAADADAVSVAAAAALPFDAPAKAKSSLYRTGRRSRSQSQGGTGAVYGGGSQPGSQGASRPSSRPTSHPGSRGGSRGPSRPATPLGPEAAAAILGSDVHIEWPSAGGNVVSASADVAPHANGAPADLPSTAPAVASPVLEGNEDEVDVTAESNGQPEPTAQRT